MLKRLVLALVLLAGAAFAAPTAVLAEDCPIREGQIVESTLDGKHYVILSLTPSSGCLVEYRSVDPYTGPFDPYINGMLGDFLTPYDGPVANTKQFGCPWEAGDVIDLSTPGGWQPATILQSDKTCAYAVEYYDNGLPTPVKVSPSDANDVIRTGSLRQPSENEIETAKVCPPGGTSDDYADDSVDSRFKRAIIADANKRHREPVNMYFDKIRYGQMKVIEENSQSAFDYPDAMVGSELYPFRLDVRICIDSSGRPNMLSSVEDYDCYTDQFGDFLCRLHRR